MVLFAVAFVVIEETNYIQCERSKTMNSNNIIPVELVCGL
jgi:hypothetical protein